MPASPAHKPPAILLHSGGMSSRQWRKLSDALSATHRVLAPDFLGSGANPPWPEGEPFEFAQDLDLIEKLVLGLGEPAHVVGHSYGGLIAVQLARRIPRSIASLTAYDPVAFGVLHAAADAEGLADLARVEEDPIFTDRALGGSEAWFERFVDYWNGPGTWRAMPAPGREAFLRVGRKVFLEVWSLMHDRTPASAYANVTAKALFLTGEKTPAAARRTVALLAAALPNGRAVTIAGAGHMGPISHAAAVNEAIVAHLSAS